MRRVLCFSCLPIVLVLVDFYPPQAWGQARFSVVENRNWHGSELPENALRIESDRKIFHVDIDSINRIAYIQTREYKKGQWTKRGSLTAFDLKGRAAKWQEFLNYNNSSFALADGVPVISDPGGSRGLDRTTGKGIWYSNREVLVGVPGTGTAITARFNHISKISLTTGKEIWVLDAVSAPSQSGFTLFGDSIMIIPGAGVTFINLRSGENWSVKGKAKAHGITTPAVGAMVNAGVLGGMIGITVVTALTTRYSGIPRTGSTSQHLLMKDSCIYFTDLKKVAKYDLTGDAIWEFPTPGSRDVPKIIFLDGVLYVIHYGVLHTPDKMYHGYIYILKIDETRDPARMEMKVFGEVKRQYLNDFLMRDSTVVLAMSDRLTTVSLSDLTVVNEKILGDASNQIGISNIVNPPFYSFEDSTLVSLSESCPRCVYILNTAGSYIKFSEDLEMESIVRPDDLYVVKQILPNELAALQSAAETVWVDENGKVRTPISLGPNGEFKRGYIVDIRENQLVVVEWPD